MTSSRLRSSGAWDASQTWNVLSTIYLHADMSIKEKALALTTPAAARPGRYRPPDKILAFLDRL